ncbi:hypothetical protein GGR55DRAFT_375066 [Xylaria sp. FL0064]|nr:hypothetical protein GGR55DRAFT_375066 [Xylaria sp. FL0064]
MMDSYLRTRENSMEGSLRCDVDAFVSESDPILEIKRARRSAWMTRNMHHVLNAVLTIVLLLSSIAVWLHGVASCGRDMRAATKSLRLYSPALAATKPGSRVTTFNYTKWSPFNPDNKHPMEYVEGNWTQILRVGTFSLSEDDRCKVGLSNEAVRLPPESGGGFMAYLSSHHHLHCLFMLHQSLHPEYYETRSVVWNLSAELRLSHWDHCIEALRQYVTCEADTTVLTFNWYEGLRLPVTNQGTSRKCADWDAHYQWQLEHQAPAPPQSLTRTPDASVQSPQPDHPPPNYLSMYLGTG